MKAVFKKPTKRQVFAFLRYALIVIAGNALAAAASAFFIIPNGFVMGGTTGVGIFVRNLLERAGTPNEWVVSFTVYVANIALFILGAFLLGKKFAVATVAGTLLYPTFISAFTAVNDLYLSANDGHAIAYNEPLLAVICGALLFGSGIGIVVRVGASTGGTDIPPLILNKFFGTPVSGTMWILDFAIVLMQFFAGATVEKVLYGILITLITSVAIDKVSPIGMRRSQVKIISKKYREIREMILNKLNRGVTMLYGRTGFLQEKCYVLLTVVSNRDVVKLKNEVRAIDPEAFLMVSVVSEVRGRGFSSDRIALPKEEEALDDLEEVPDSPTEIKGCEGESGGRAANAASNGAVSESAPKKD